MKQDFFHFVTTEHISTSLQELYKTENSVAFEHPFTRLQTTYYYEEEGSCYMNSLFPGAFFYRSDQTNREKKIVSTRFFVVVPTDSHPILLSASTVEIYTPLQYVTVHASREINGVSMMYEAIVDDHAEIVRDLKRKMKEWILNTKEYRLSHVTGLIV